MLKLLNVADNSMTELGVNEIAQVMSINPVLQELRIDKGCLEILNQCDEQFLYNETVGKWYYLVPVHSADELYSSQEDITLSRVWDS